MFLARCFPVFAALLTLAAPPLAAQRERRFPTANEAPGPALGVEIRAEAGGLRVVTVAPGSSAEAAGIRVGDLIVACMGRPVTDVALFQRQVGIAHASGVPYGLEVERGGSRQAIQIQPVGGRIQRRFPGAVAGGASANSAVPMAGPVAAPLPGRGFNVLRYAALDPATGDVVLWGDYDPAYPTGPLPYRDLLAEAVRNPSPSFTLEPTAEGRDAGRALDQLIAADSQRMARDPAYAQTFGERLVRVLGVDLAHRPDGQRFARKCAQAFGLTPAEAMDVLQPQRGQQSRGQNGYMALVAKALRHLGAPGVSQAIESMLQGDTWGAIDRLGVGGPARQAQADYKAGRLSEQAASNRLLSLLWGAFLTNMGVNPSQVEGERARRGEAAFVPWAQEQFTNWLASKVMKTMFHGMVLSEEALMRLYPRVRPVVVEPRCLDGLDPRSELAQAFYRGDVALKSILSTPDLADRVPGHVAQAQAMHEFMARRGYLDQNASVRGRTWLRPGAVALSVDPGGRVVRFGEARVEVRTQMLEDPGNLGRVFQEGLDAYTSGITARYDAYARHLPDLHRMRESAKVLALARWARSRGVALRLEPGAPRVLPATAPVGFVQATFLVEGERFFWQPASIGGVDFGPQVGEGWVQARPDAQVIPSALGQLQASAALAGQAADRALAGDLEGARDLAQRSADAMTGRLQGGLPPLPAAPVPADPLPLAQAGTGLLERVQTATAALKAGGPEAEAARADLAGLRDQAQQVAQRPSEAPKVVALLRNPGPMPAGPVATPSAAAPQPPAMAVAATNLSAEEQRKLRAEVAALRQELCFIRARMVRFNATIQMDQGQRAQWENEVQQAQERSFERLKEMLLELPPDLLESRWQEAVDKGLRSPEERARLKKALELLGRFKDAKTFGAFADWASQEDTGAERVRDGLTQIYDILDGDEVLRKMLQRWIKRPIPGGARDLYDAAKNVVDTGFDLLAEGFAWARLRDLNRTAPLFLKAVKAMGDRQAQVLAAIHAREQKLGLPPGATREPCE